MPTSPQIFALIPCGGTGTRAMGNNTILPKQYQSLAGLPMVAHTLAAFAAVPRVAHVCTVVAPQDTFFALHTGAAHSVAACAGKTRAITVLNGLKALLTRGARSHDWVLVHDAARCLVTPGQINALIDACQHDSVGGLLALALPDTLKSAHSPGTAQVGRVAATVNRADKWLAQTPQMFRIGALIDALQAAGDHVTDESSAMELAGCAPMLVPSSAHNFKVTYPEDFALAEALLLNRKNTV